jgi:internalin A
LRLEGNLLREVPETLMHFKQLEHLDLGANQLQSVPAALFELPALQYLDLSTNQLTALPRPRARSLDLRLLALSTNRLASLPHWVGQFADLMALTVSENPLEAMPDDMARLTEMRYFACSHCLLSTLPPALKSWRRLEYVALGGPALLTLPAWIGRAWPELRGLDLSSNNTVIHRWQPNYKLWSTVQDVKAGQLRELPESMKDLANLHELYLHGQPELRLPREILGPDWDEANRFENKRGKPSIPAEPAGILDYYFRSRHGPRRPLNEVKLILVGRGGVGKTCLIRRLTQDTFDEHEPETAGIEIHTWPVTIDGEDVRVHVWDFGGQEILHATHQFFFTERSLYLLVVSGREGNPTEDAEYWLQLIKSFGGDSPVVIALNKAMQHPFDLNRGLLLEKYPFIADFVKTDCRQSEDGERAFNAKPPEGGLTRLMQRLGPRAAVKRAVGIDALKTRLMQLTQTMEHRKAEFPADWFQIKERLAGMGEDFISWEQYQAICNQSGETSPAAQRDLARYLHILGIALNYSDDPRLQDTRVLKPRWVTEGIYTLLRASQGRATRGVLTPSEIVQKLDPVRYPVSKHDFLLRLMERFQLCFRMPGAQESYLVPELLGDDQPSLGDVFAASGLRFRYQYEVLPEGVLPRFIVQTHALSEGRPELRWRSGVVLERNGCRAVVRADVRERRIDVVVTGVESRQRALLEVIREKLEQQHRDMRGLAVDERVPIPGESQATVGYQHLLTLEEEGEEWVRPEGARQRHRVTDLLNGVESTQSRGTRRSSGIELQATSEGRNGRSRVFVSYSHKDHRLFGDFKTMLAPAIQRGLIDLWSDKDIEVGEEWRDQIDAAIARAKVAMLLVSKDFLASPFIVNHELGPLLDSARTEGVKVFWVCLSPCLHASTEIERYQAAHDVGRPLSQMEKPQRDAAIRSICAKLLEITGDA